MKTRVRRIPAVFLFGVTALVALVAEAAAPSPLDTMFTGYKAIGSTKWDVKANAVVQWKAMMDRFKQQQADCQPTDGCARFKQLVATLTGLSTLDQMKAVHRVEYALPYVEDINNYKKADYWATPYETLSIGSGDAEDFAILDYYAMRAAGMPAAAMRVMAVRLKSQGGVGHAVLGIDTTPEPQILDHRVPPIMAVSVVHKEFQPAIGVNEDGWWVYVGAAQ